MDEIAGKDVSDQHDPQKSCPHEHVDQDSYSYAVCKSCWAHFEWIECYNCEDGYSHHDCLDDTCACADPEPNVVCDVCDGQGGWWAPVVA